MDIVYITNVDNAVQNNDNNLFQRQKALEEVKQAIRMVNCSNLYIFSVIFSLYFIQNQIYFSYNYILNKWCQLQRCNANHCCIFNSYCYYFWPFLAYNK